MNIGVILPSVEVQRRDGLDIPTAARHAEAAGLHSVWHGDHLAIGAPTLDCAVALAAAAAATSRVRVGASVFVPAIRPLAWAAKQVASLQHVSAGRLILGIGSGGGEAQWAAAGVPYAERGPRTDVALRLLPRLLAGEPVDLPDGPPVTLLPPVPAPPVWVGNRSRVAIRRAARFGDGWFPSLLTAADVAAGAALLASIDSRRPTPVIAVGATGALGADPAVPDRHDIAAGITRAYGMPSEQALDIPITGGPAEAAERFAAYAAAGASHLVVGFAGGDWRRQCDLFAEAARIMNL